MTLNYQKKLNLCLLKVVIVTSILTIGVTVNVNGQTSIPLYSGNIPNSKKTPADYMEYINRWGTAEKVSVPTLTPYLLEKGTMHTAMLVIPGGGYANVAVALEGNQIAIALNKIGVEAFVLKYRLPNDNTMDDKSIGPLQDAQTALMLIRQNAKRWNIDTTKIGVIGFSAGGHLASTLGTHFDKPVIQPPANISLRPDFMALIYPVITMGALTHYGSRVSLLGKDPSPQLIDLYSNEKQVTAKSPPTFLVQAEDDRTVPVQNSLIFYEALLQNKVSAELHIYPSGGHGFGLKNAKISWLDRLKDWLIIYGWLKEQ
ncbi:alpha/beta hydrolase [Mucilaginibacter sp. UR6-11]|uniref:alpha/beta hydrolase n=1 Tax=Mucilaginibacter sp. UR6-11 TaxID=1435644 RepID=UPI001E3416DE|nr:alpha/beta hydrolase [Mucilaginibacter sp. UR6-11]MCC8425008.1 alpha/beta hydrolase [Mucilaginibacter sp. UR6-11]